jgi:hypothetical protein
MTFNLNLSLAEQIDALPVKNRSEWANKALQEVLDNRLETTKDALEKIRLDAAVDGAEVERQAILDSPRRAIVTALLALERAGLDNLKHGRYTAEEYLNRLLRDVSE